MSTDVATTFMGRPVPAGVLCVGSDRPDPGERFPVGHPVGDAVTAIHSELDRVTDAGLWSLQPAELQALLRACTRLTARAEELELRVAHAAERADVGAADASTSTGVWWANATNQTKAGAIRRLGLARALDSEHEPVRDALAEGAILTDQATAIVRAVDALRTGPAKDLVDPETVTLAQKTLIGLAGDHDAKALRILGRRILDIVAPEVGEAVEAQQLAREEREAFAKARLTMHEDGHGSVHGRFTLPATHGAMLRKHLMALAAPFGKARPDDSAADVGQGPGRSPLFGPEQLGVAFMAYLERYPTDRLPTAGGIAADVVVTIDHDSLLRGLGSAVLDTGAVISPAMTRMMACDAGIIPLVMGGKSVVLDCGRKRRFHTKTQRIAIAARDSHCTADGCDHPPGLCHVHHDIAWSKGGPTDVDHGRLLCPKHHHRAHDPAFTMAKLPTGKVTFTRRT